MDEFLKEKLQLDYIDCTKIDKAILLGSIDRVEGTLILYDFIDYVKADIATLDKESFDILCKAEIKIKEAVEQSKKEIQSIKKIKDASDKRDLQDMMVREDYKGCKLMLHFLQNLCYKAGYFQ